MMDRALKVHSFCKKNIKHSFVLRRKQENTSIKLFENPPEALKK